jgi:hypothetical protein
MPKTNHVRTPEDRWVLIRMLKEAVHRAPFARVEEVGRLVVEHCFANDLRAWRDRNPRKCASYRKLADDPRLPLSKSSLQRDTGVYVALRTLPAEVVRGRSVTHVAAVLSLDEPMRIQFLQLAKERSMSTRSLQEAVVEFRRKAGERRGRPLVRPLGTSLRLLHQAVVSIERTVHDLPLAGAVDARLCGEIDGLIERLRAARQDLVQRTQAVAASDSSFGGRLLTGMASPDVGQEAEGAARIRDILQRQDACP